MTLTLDLKNKTLEDIDRRFNYAFEDWSYEISKSDSEGTYTLGDLTISAGEISKVIFEPEKETISFEAEYDGEYPEYITIESETSYNEEILQSSLFFFLETYVEENPFDGGEGILKGEAETYYDYDKEEFVFKLNELILEEN